jgi:hypothetical protein
MHVPQLASVSAPAGRGTGEQSKLPRQLYRLSLSGVDHVDRAAVPTVFDGKRYNAADAYEPQPELNVAAEKFEAWLRDSFEAGLVALSSDICNEGLINAQRRSIELSVEP